MESIAKLASELSNNKKLDLRLESAACKEWNTHWGWQILDDTVQIRGGRGYETERSMAARGEDPIMGVERILRDFRINRIFEGSSEIMHLLMAREAVDKHLEVAGALIEKKSTLMQKIKALPKIALFYAYWYPTRCIGWSWWPRFMGYGKLGKHLRFIDRNARKLARQSFHGMALYREKMEHKQMFLFRLVDIVNDLFAMSASISRAEALRKRGAPNAGQAAELADAFCKLARRRVHENFYRLWHNDDSAKYQLAQDVMSGRHDWQEEILEPLLTEFVPGNPAQKKEKAA
jgi:hypothetical protein